MARFATIFGALLVILVHTATADENRGTAEQAQALLQGANVVGAFQNLAAAKLWNGDEPLDQDVVICGDDEEAKRQVSALAEQIRGVRAVDGGPLSSARYVEGITVLLVGINKRYKALAGVRIAGL